MTIFALFKPSISGKNCTRCSLFNRNTSRKSCIEQPPPRTILATRSLCKNPS
ncbi:unnamed protein product [Schistosoma mattheei]|uniref:Uncharacterized protein n=1 Tax=Schistosoma mattheei TaxID=31246 RepID=A0A3P8FDL9_9TREM|nr:unnamed protein product [Schistosoma mattheei]